LTDSVTIAIDVMGGDFGPRITIPAAQVSLRSHPELRLILIGHQDQMFPYIQQLDNRSRSRIEIRHAPDVIDMDEKPATVLRGKPLSSMRVGIEAVKSGDAQAFVSAGNTGALLALGTYILKRAEGIDRPAICSAIPTVTGHCYMLDLGANVDSSPEQLHQFAVMGTLLAKAIDNNRQPKVALLNIGAEEIKGNSQVKDAAQLLQENPMINYSGYVEGNTLFDGIADVVVCDGFAGNIALKASEGVAGFVAKKIQVEASRSLMRKMLAFMSAPIFRNVFRQIDPRTFNGATFLGLRGVVVKSHGNADIYGFSQAIEQTLNTVKYEVVNRINSKFQSAIV